MPIDSTIHYELFNVVLQTVLNEVVVNLEHVALV